MKISWRDRDTFISIGGMRDSFEIDSGMRDLKSLSFGPSFLGLLIFDTVGSMILYQPLLGK